MGMQRKETNQEEVRNYFHKYNFNYSLLHMYMYVAGYGRNQAILQSSGKFLCFMDAVSYKRIIL